MTHLYDLFQIRHRLRALPFGDGLPRHAKLHCQLLLRPASLLAKFYDLICEYHDENSPFVFAKEIIPFPAVACKKADCKICQPTVASAENHPIFRFRSGFFAFHGGKICPSRIHTGQDIAGIFDTSLQYGCSCWDKSAHNEIRDFYAHMALTHERRFARCFCRYSGNIASDISGIIKNLYHHPSWNAVQIFLCVTLCLIYYLISDLDKCSFSPAKLSMP